MKISKEEIIRINKNIGGSLISDSSIDYAIELQENKKLGEYKKLAYIWRAILVDHPFSDANKRTAIIIAFDFAEQNRKFVDQELLVLQAQSIASKNIKNIRNIEWRLKNAIH